MNEVLRLDQVRSGGVAKLVGFARCRRRGLRLAELGLTPGTSVEVLQASPGQPMMLRVRGTQLAIDRQTARRICVELISGDHAARPGGRRSSLGGRRRGLRRQKPLSVDPGILDEDDLCDR